MTIPSYVADYVLGEELIAQASVQVETDTAWLDQLRNNLPQWLDLLRRTRYLPISPKHRLYLEVIGHGDDARFGGIFRDVWFKIPEDDRKQMSDHWTAHPSLGGNPPFLAISIRLENLSSLRDGHRLGQCGMLGTALQFYSPAVDLMLRKRKRRHVAALIAHELAHVLQFSKDQVVPMERPEWLTDEVIVETAEAMGVGFEQAKARMMYVVDPVEHHADRIAAEWGFNVRAMLRWIHKSIRWCDLPEPVSEQVFDPWN